MGTSGSKTAEKRTAQDYEPVRETLKMIMSNPDFDDGSYAPVFIRLGWHSSGTYDGKNGEFPGGSSGATMRYDTEANDPENIGLEVARTVLEEVKQKHPWISYSDLWILAAYVALEVTGGPVIEFCPGRSDREEKSAIKPGRLPHAEEGLGKGLDSEGRINGWENLAAHIRYVFNRMGFNDQEIVALIAGGHMYGRCHLQNSGYNGAWVENPTKFSNEFARDLLEDEWMFVEHDTKVKGQYVPEETRPAPGKRQYMTKWEPEEIQELDESTMKNFQVGKYKIAVGWVNVRRGYQVDSYIIDQPKKDTEFNIWCVKKVGGGIRGQLDCGGWISLIATDGSETLAERCGDLELVPGNYRLLQQVASLNEVKLFESPEDLNKISEHKLDNLVINISDFFVTNSEIFGKISGLNLWTKLVDHSLGGLFERIIKGYNETPRKSIKRLQVKYQMMLPADMVMLWDDQFRLHLERYAKDEEVLKTEFGQAYQKLTELGCPACPAMKKNVNKLA